MKTSLLLVLSLVSLFFSTSAAAIADIKGYYLGGLGGYSQYTEASSDESSFSYGAYGGYYTSKDFALETTYFRTGNLADNLDANYVSLSAKFHHYFSNTYSMFIKVGVASVDVNGIYSYDGIGWLWGAGFNMALSKNINIRLGYERVMTELEAPGLVDTVDTDLGSAYLGVHYQF
ncbi:outer membrane beta-barrel protein [Shewanella sp. AS1]|uniref:outer membrane beta-barrel protein n=1 Tax=Shewanella sp. AS1 TaxID=2907626 RepID=UPI001F423317|nr:outer membrane beta-barrel protein [Shewanella sp. AS1]MCE9678133.1 outer membrane beta-barrel protein [Shewanella sp. AS1]